MAKVLVGHKSTNKLIFEYLARFSSTDLTFMCRLAKILVWYDEACQIEDNSVKKFENAKMSPGPE